MRVAFYSPLPPERSGIADYSYELLEELRHHVEVTAVVAYDRLRAARCPDGVELVSVSDADDLVVDCNLYQMGNNPKYHRFFWGRAFEKPGLLLMHDPSLADFTAEMCGGAESAIFRDEVAYDCPDIALEDDLPLVEVGNGRKDLDRLRVLLARRIVESNVRTLVHSSAMAREMRHRYPGADIQTIQLPAPVLAEPVRAAPRPAGEVVFGVFGGINYYKRVRPLVDAFLEVLARHPLARMVIAGRADDHLLERELRAIAVRPELAGALEVKTDLSLAALEHEMQSCDVGISLRWPTAGEMSATLMRTFGAGRPAIVSDVLQFRELDERYCWRVTTDFDHEHDRLVELMEQAARDREMCRRAGEAARAFVEGEATYRVVAHQYVEHLEHCAARQAEKGAARAVYALRGSRPLGVNVVQLAGRSEVADAARRTTAALRASGMDVVVVELPPALGPTRSGGATLDEAPLEPERASARQEGGAPTGTGTGRLLAGADDDADDAEAVARAVSALDPDDRGAVATGPHPFDLYFVETGEADRFGRLARVRRARGRRVVPVLAPGIVPLTTTHRLLLELAEAVLAPSGHAADVVRMSTLAPVHVVPWPAAGPPPATGPPDGTSCTFVTVVEARSAVARANPWASIAAFRKAFSRAERGTTARLVVVLDGAGPREEARERLAEEAAAVSGRFVVDPTPAELLALVAASDVYVSLHRGVGFGLGLADAMALGKPVIATGYSGNLEYMDERSACLVGYEVSFVDRGDLYLDPATEDEVRWGRFWVEPDVEAAARWMRKLAGRSGLRTRIGALAAQSTERCLRPERAADEVRALLSTLMTSRGPGARGLAAPRTRRRA